MPCFAPGDIMYPYSLICIFMRMVRCEKVRYPPLSAGFLFVGDAVSSVSAISLAVVAATTVVALIPLVAAGNALGIFRFGIQIFGDSMKRLPSRKRTWGVVFDAETLRPLPFAVVRLLGKDKRILEKRIADAEGRYGFLTTPSSLHQKGMTIEIDVDHEGYSFPSRKEQDMAGVLYGEVYRGGTVEVQETALINYDVPMDPVNAVRVHSEAKTPSVAAGVATAAMADAGLWVGLVTVPLAVALSPNPFSLGVLFLFLGVASLRLFGIAEHPFGTVSDKEGNAVPFALLTLHDDGGKRIAFAVSDPRGRYVMSVGRGSYIMTAHTPANVSPPREIERSIASRRGWITQQVIL